MSQCCMFPSHCPLVPARSIDRILSTCSRPRRVISLFLSITAAGLQVSERAHLADAQVQRLPGRHTHRTRLAPPAALNTVYDRDASVRN
jgi:hypothetical protein